MAGTVIGWLNVIIARSKARFHVRPHEGRERSPKYDIGVEGRSTEHLGRRDRGEVHRAKWLMPLSPIRWLTLDQRRSVLEKLTSTQAPHRAGGGRWSKLHAKRDQTAP